MSLPHRLALLAGVALSYDARGRYTVQGLWPQVDEGYDIQSMDRSPDGELLVKGDDHGNIHVCYFPCVQHKEVLSAPGHATHVSKVRWVL